MTVVMAAAVAHLVSMEVLWGTVPTVAGSVAMVRIFTVVAMIGTVAIVDVAMEVFRTAKPWTGTDKDAIRKPFRTVVTIRSATVRRGIVETIRANGRYTDADADLGLRSGNICCNA